MKDNLMSSFFVVALAAVLLVTLSVGALHRSAELNSEQVLAYTCSISCTLSPAHWF